MKITQCVACIDDLCSSGTLQNVDWYLVTGIPGNLLGPYSRAKQFKKKERKAFFLDFLNLADFTGSLSRNGDTTSVKQSKKNQRNKNSFFLDCMSHAEGTRVVPKRNNLPIYDDKHPIRGKISFTMRRKPEITHAYVLFDLIRLVLVAKKKLRQDEERNVFLVFISSNYESR